MDGMSGLDGQNSQDLSVDCKKRSLSPRILSPTKCLKLSEEKGKPQRRRSFVAGRLSTIGLPVPFLDDDQSQSEESETEKPKRVLLPNPINEQSKEAAKCTEADIQKFQNECDEWKRVVEGFKQKVEDLEKNNTEDRVITEKPPTLSALQQKWLDDRPNYQDKLNNLKSTYSKLDLTMQCLKLKISQMNNYTSRIDKYIESVSTNFKSSTFTDGENLDPKHLITELIKFQDDHE